MADSLVISGLAGLFDELGQSLVELNPADTVFTVKLWSNGPIPFTETPAIFSLNLEFDLGVAVNSESLSHYTYKSSEGRRASLLQAIVDVLRLTSSQIGRAHVGLL